MEGSLANPAFQHFGPPSFRSQTRTQMTTPDTIFQDDITYKNSEEWSQPEKPYGSEECKRVSVPWVTNLGVVCLGREKNSPLLAVKFAIRDRVAEKGKRCKMVGMPLLIKAYKITVFHPSKALQSGCLPPFSPWYLLVIPFVSSKGDTGRNVLRCKSMPSTHGANSC